MEHSPAWEANSHSATQEVSRLLWNPKVHYLIHTILPLVPVPSQINLVHTLQPHFPEIHFSIIFPSIPRSSEWFLPFRLTIKIIVWTSHLSHARYMPRPSHHPWHYQPNNIWWSVHILTLIMQSSPASRHFLPLVYKYSPQYPVPENPQSMFFSLCERSNFTHIQNKKRNYDFIF
jgi:hypothetical protein